MNRKNWLLGLLLVTGLASAATIYQLTGGTPDSDDLMEFQVLTGGTPGGSRKVSVGVIRGEQGTAGSVSNYNPKSGVNTLDTDVQGSYIAPAGYATGSVTNRSGVKATNDVRNIIGGETGLAGITGSTSYTSGDADLATISGGYDHLNDQLAGTIAGGGHNWLAYLGTHGTISGGSLNSINGASDYSTIGGGTENSIGGVYAGSWSSVGGCDSCTIAGGYANSLYPGTNNNTIGGGTANFISATGSNGANTIAGGSGNSITGATTDRATIVGGASNTIGASSIGSVIAGGISNTVTQGNYSFVGAGNGNSVNTATGYVGVYGESHTVTGNHLMAFGRNTSAVIPGSLNFTAREFTPDGSAQAISFVLARQTPDATPLDLSVYGTSTFASVPNNSAWVGTVLLVGRQQGTQNAISFWFPFAITKATGNITVEYTGSTTALHDDITGLGAPAITTGTSTFRITVTGKAATTIDWVARVDLVQTLQ